MTEYTKQISTMLSTGEETIGNIESFDEFLQINHFEDNPELLDDELSDAYDEWVAELAPEDVLFYAKQYSNKNAQVIAKDFCQENGIEDEEREEVEYERNADFTRDAKSGLI